MSMTKKHFEAISKIIYNRFDRDNTEASEIHNRSLFLVANDLAAYFQTQNSMFDREKFFGNAGVK